MNIGLLSLAALIFAIALSMFSRINIGIIAIALAWIVGVVVAGMKPEIVVAGFPSNLFLTLVGVTLLFACAEINGTLRLVSERAVSIVGHRRELIPVMFFLLALVVSTVGPGAISAVALIVPLAMVISDRAGIPQFLTALMVANGANAGNLSPVSSVGVIANTKMAEAGIVGHEWKVWFSSFAAHAAVSAAAYLFLIRKVSRVPAEEYQHQQHGPFQKEHLITVAVILLWIVGVVGFHLNLGLSAFFSTAALIFLTSPDEAKVVKQAPWGVIIMVCGVSVLISLLEKTGGMEQFINLLARVSRPGTVNGIIALVTGAISTYSSTSGVVLPAFLPVSTRLVQQIGGGDPLAVALSIDVGSAIVDVSPLSTLGALCIAAVADPAASKELFRKLMFWGFSMIVVGALLCQLFAGFIARF